MFEFIGVFAVWALGGIACAFTPVYIGGLISDRRRDDGKAFYLSLPVALAVMFTYGLASTIVLFHIS